VLRNRFTEDWHGREADLRASPDAGSAWSAGWSAGDPERANTFVGEAVGLIGAIEPAGHVIERMVDEAATLLRASGDGAAR
jgi:nitronate monooxygenase